MPITPFIHDDNPPDGAQETAGAWHGGMWSALYAYASSGSVMPGLSSEITRCITETILLPVDEQEVERVRLRALLAHIEPLEAQLPEV